MIYPFSDLTLSEKFWKSNKMIKSCINGEKRVTYIGSKIMYIGHWSLFMPPPKNRKYLCHPVLSHPRNFYTTPNFDLFMPPIFILPWIFLCFKEKFEIEEVYRRFEHTFFIAPHFFFAPFRKLKSWCHPYFMPPWKSLCHPRGWDKKYGSGIKKNQWHRVTCGKIWRCGCRFSS